MRYAQARKMDISNGENLGISLFVQGCHRHCYNCFNPETWDFNNGKKWTEETQKNFIKLADKPYIHRISILGGEPLDDENIQDIKELLTQLYIKFPDKKIWMYTGYSWDEVLQDPIKTATVRYCDILIDNKYDDTQRDITLKWRGSTNQRVIDVKQSCLKGEIILYDD